MDEVVASLGDRVDDRRHARDPDLQPAVEGHVDLGHRAQPPIDVGVGADHLDVEAADAALADLLERVRDPVHPADPVGNQRDPRAVAVAARQLGLLAAEERRGGRIRDRRHAGIEQRQRSGAEVELPAVSHRHDRVDRAGELALVDAPGPAVEVGVAELAVLQHRDQPPLVDPQLHRLQPGAKQRDRVVGPEVGAGGTVADVSLREHAFGDPQHGRRIGPRGAVAAQRPDRQRHRRVGPLRGAALVPVGSGVAGPDVREELGGGGGGGRLGERPPDVDSGVVIGPADGGAPVGLDVHERRQVQLFGPGAVAGLPDREQLGQAAAVPRRQRFLHRVERMRERRGDLPGVQVRRARLDVVVVGLQPLVVVGRDPIAEHVNGLGLALEPHGQLLGDERVGQVLQGPGALDRVVVGDRHEVHSAALGQVVDLARVGGAFGDVERSLDSQLRQLGCRRVHVHIGAGRFVHGSQLDCWGRVHCEEGASVL